MAVLYVLIPLALVLAGAGVLAFRWAVRSGQFDDVETPALRMLIDEEGMLTNDDRASTRS
ncbi:MAG: cbb3-type cytochrome oxidase assembly protein CcoS [Bacteroidota bacterium]